jgi:hypothetical protein
MVVRRDPKPVASGRSRHGNGDGAAHDVVKTPDRLALDDVFLNHEALRRGLTENLNARRIESDKVAERVEKAFAKISLSKPAENDRSPLNHVAPDASTFDAVNAVVHRRVDAIRKSDAASVVSVRAGSKLVQWDEARRAENHATDGPSGSLELEPLLNFVNVRRSGPLFASASTEAARYETEGQAQKIIDDVVANGSGDKPQRKQDADRAAVDLSADELVAQSVNVQMKSATAPEDQLTYGLIPNGAAADKVQTSLLQTFELRPGASDVTAYHDFHTLRMAFEHVWTRLFDGDLEKLGRKLYKEYVGLKDFLGYDPATDRSITSLDDLKWLINEIRSLSDFAQEVIPPQLTNGQGDPAGTPKGASDVTSDVARTTGTVLTGGASLFIEWAFNELIKLGNRPVVVTWNDFPLKPNEGRGNIIELLPPEQNALPQGTVEIVLEADTNSYKKRISFQQWDHDTQRVVYSADLQNFGGGHGPIDRLVLNAAQVQSGTLKFISEDEIVNELLLGRYVLGDLTEKINDRTRVRFHWKGQR